MHHDTDMDVSMFFYHVNDMIAIGVALCAILGLTTIETARILPTCNLCMHIMTCKS